MNLFLEKWLPNDAIGCLFALMNFLFAWINMHFLKMNVKWSYCLSVDAVNTRANVVLGGFFRVNKVYFGVNESIFILTKYLLTQMNEYFL